MISSNVDRFVMVSSLARTAGALLLPLVKTGSRSDHVHAASDGNSLAGHERSIVGSEECDDTGVVLRFAHSLERDAAYHRVLPLNGLFAFAENRRHHRRIGRAGTDRVEQHALAREFARDRLGEADQSAFAS